VVPRFMAVALQGIEVKPSPLWLQCELIRLGGKPINNIVDVTNYVMLLTAQPTHAYDYDKLRGRKLVARMARDGETVKLLNDKTYELNEADIVIADGEGPVGLAGVMGGGDSEVSTETKNIVLEVATFDMYAVRKSSMRHGVFTDALSRFNKGQSPLQNDHVLSLLLRSVLDVSPGKQVSAVFDEASAPTDTYDSQDIDRAFINARLGLELGSEEIAAILRNVEFLAEAHEDTVRYTAPFWRTDIELPEDIVEEVGRLYGFDKLPRLLPARSTKPAPRNEKRTLKQHIRDSLSKAGANEVLTYSFVHENVLKRAGQNPEEAFRLGNALSPDLQYYRLSVLPSLLDKVHPNIKAGHNEFALFELGKGHHKQNIADDGLPMETDLLELVYASRKPHEGAAYYQMRRMVEVVLGDLGVNVTFEPIPEKVPFAGMAPYDHKRSAFIKTTDGTSLGVVGELTAATRRGFKLPDYTAAATLDITSLLNVRRSISYRSLPRFPKVSQDISLKVPVTTNFYALYKLVDDTVRAADVSSGYALVEPLAIYQPEGGATKTITLHIEVASENGTLTDRQVGAVLDAVAERAANELQAERI
jgi:phenylalanyl-tRNA synthetase beta chain